jgi:hypothetical protein
LEERLKELSLQVEKWKLWLRKKRNISLWRKNGRKPSALYQEMIKLHKQKINLLKKKEK